MPVNLPVYDENNCSFFGLGRNAMYAACLVFGLKPGDQILTPAFDCDGSLQPFKTLGCSLSFFRSDPYTFCADVEDIRRRINPNTKLIHIINHFGMPQPWDDILPIRKEVAVPILEDNAYSLFSSFKDRPLGTFGDAAVFSLRKNLPMVDGGMLRINNPVYKFDMPKNHQRWCYPTEYANLLSILMSSLKLSKAGRLLNRIKKKIYPSSDPPVPLYSEGKGYPSWDLRDVIGPEFLYDYLRPISKIAKFQLDKITFKEYNVIIEKKRFYYQWLSRKLAGIKPIRVLYPELSEGIVPFSLSFLVPSKRDIFFKVLRDKYNLIMAWPILSKLVLDRLEDFPEVEILGRRLLQINLPADMVILDYFGPYLENLVRDIYDLSEKYL